MTFLGTRLGLALAAILLTLSTGSVSVLASSALPQDGARPPGRCPARMVCNRALGIALVPAPGDFGIPPGHVPRYELGMVRRENQANFNQRLDITSWGTWRKKRAAVAASAGMDRLLRGLRPHSVPRKVRYGGDPGVLVRILATGPGPETAIILAHDGSLYKILAPGAHRARDQRQMLATLRFITRVGPFPPSNG